MGWFKKTFSECFGISPGESDSPGLYRFVFLGKVAIVLLALFSLIWCGFGVDAATVSEGDSTALPVQTEAPEDTPAPSPTDKPTPTPAPEPTASPVPEYVIENEVNLDGANLYGDAANVVLYAQEVVLASEEEGETGTSAFPEKSGYFVVPISDTECAYVPEGYDYWLVCELGTFVSNSRFYLCTINSGLKIVGVNGNTYHRYYFDGTLRSQYGYFSSVECEHGYQMASNAMNFQYTSITSVYGKNITYCEVASEDTEPALESMVLSSSALSFVNSASQELTATVSPEDFSGTLTWTSTDESVARYSGGLVIPVADGTCQIIASYVNPDGTVISASCDITVALPVVDEEPTDLEVFLQEPVEVDRYQYEILKRLEFMQYALAIQLALIFILIFKRK